MIIFLPLKILDKEVEELHNEIGAANICIKKFNENKIVANFEYDVPAITAQVKTETKTFLEDPKSSEYLTHSKTNGFYSNFILFQSIGNQPYNTNNWHKILNQ